METLPLGKIRTDGGTQMRVNIDTSTMLEYRDAWKTGVEFDPIDVFYDGTAYWLADGFHRFYGAREAKKKDIVARVHTGSVRDATLFACGANLGHGLRRTSADKRQAVLVLLEDGEWSTWSDRVIADKCGVGNQLVSQVRAELCESHSSHNGQDELPKKTKGKDGKLRPSKKKPKQKPEPEPEPITELDDEDTGHGYSEAYQQLRHWWGEADDAAKTLFRLWIDGEVD